MPLDRQSGAFLGAIEREGRDDRLAVGGECGAKRLGITRLIRRIGEEMEHGAIVPKGVLARRRPARDIGRDPLDAIRVLRQPGPRVVHRLGRNIKDG